MKEKASISAWLRQFHRWMAIVFTIAVVANVILNFVVSGQEQIALWVGAATLVPLGLLMLTGLYLFALPYVRGRAAE